MPVAVTPERLDIMLITLKKAIAAGHVDQHFTVLEVVRSFRKHNYLAGGETLFRAVLRKLIEQERIVPVLIRQKKFYTLAEMISTTANRIEPELETIMPAPASQPAVDEGSQPKPNALEQLATQILLEMRKHNLTELVITADGQMLYKQTVVQQLTFSLD
jgi:hypothetical protein